MATRVGLAKIWMTPFDWSTPNPQFGAKFWHLSSMRAELWWILCVQCANFQISVSMATGVGLTKIALTQLNRPTPKTPYLVQESWWYLLYNLSNGRFCVQMTSACCRGDNDGSNRNLNDTLWLPDPKTPCLVQTSCTYLRYLSYGSSKLP